MRRTMRMLVALTGAAVLLSACQTDGSSSPQTELAAVTDKKPDADKPATPAEPPMTHSRAAMDCWMKTEKAQASGDLDKRADLVNKCIDEKMKNAPPPPKS